MALYSNGTSTAVTVPAAYVSSSIASTSASSSTLPLAATAAAVAVLSATTSSPTSSSSSPSPSSSKSLFSTPWLSSPSSPFYVPSSSHAAIQSLSPVAIVRDTLVHVASALLSSNLSLLANDTLQSNASLASSLLLSSSSSSPFLSLPAPSPLSPSSPSSSVHYAAFVLASNHSGQEWTSYNNDTVNSTSTEEPGSNYSLVQIILIALVAGFLSLITVAGNFMVMMSFKMDKQLQTISNYFLFSLAVADFAIGLISMPLNTVYLLMSKWPFGAIMCDTWLALDYLASNASVLNLLIISFDRYFSVTRPLTYRARRTTKRAVFMISCAWIISLILWPPWIYSWPYIEGRRAVGEHECYIQFLKTNLYVTLGTAIAAFYIPVTVMCVLYWQIWRETEKRQKDLTNLQAVKKDNSKRSTSSDDGVEQEEVNKRSRSDSSAAPGTEEIETTYVPTAMCIENPRYLKVPGRTKPRTFTEILCSTCLKYCKIDREPEGADEDSTSDAGHGSPGNTTPASVETPVQSSVSHCTSLTLRTDPLTAVMVSSNNAAARSRLESMIPLLDRPTGNGVRVSQTSSGAAPSSAPLPPRLHLQNRTHSSDSVFTILIRLPLDNDRSDDNQPTIQMIAEEEEDRHSRHGIDSRCQQQQRKESPRLERSNSQTSDASTDGFVVATPSAGVGAVAGSTDASLHSLGCGGGGGPGSATSAANTTSAAATCTPLAKRRISQPPDNIKLPLNAKLVPKQVMAKAAKKKKKKTQERKQDRKAAKTLSAILLAFIITWTPYNVLVLVQTIATCSDDQCIPRELWDLAYYLCYINSTVNPLCYALCNASFRRTYVRILTCKWHTTSRNPNRGFYN